MDWKSKFPRFFDKQLCVKLNRLQINEQSKQIQPKLRVTRSQSVANDSIEWVRVTNGKYKGDIAKVDFLDFKKGEGTLQLFPRINYDSLPPEFALGEGKNSSSKRRPPPKLFDLETIRKTGGDVDFKSNCWLWNGCQFSPIGLLCITIPLSDLQIEGVIPTPTEMKRFKNAQITKDDKSESRLTSKRTHTPSKASCEDTHNVSNTVNNKIQSTPVVIRDHNDRKSAKRRRSNEFRLKQNESTPKPKCNNIPHVRNFSYTVNDSMQLTPIIHDADGDRPNKRIRIEKKSVKATPMKVANKRPPAVRKSQLALLTPPDLSQYAICWVKVRGYKDWPGVIEKEVNGSYQIHFFGDYTTAMVKRNKITNFYEGFGLFKHTFEAPKLKKAVQEACICLMDKSIRSCCFVCSIIGSKKSF